MSNLNLYEEISSFNENTVLVKYENNIYVKKKVSKEVGEIYKKLINNKNINICETYEVFEFEDCTIVITEFINGKTLSSFEIFDITETKKIIAQICDGLLFLHKQNIIHRDINPNNIMISNYGIVKIIDFGISRSYKKDLKNDTEILGTVGYASPEQFGFLQTDNRTDIYSLGVLANVMLTGKLPNEQLYTGKIGRVIKKATDIDAKLRYKSIINFKYAFTNEVDENTNFIIRILRQIPGFRTWKIYKMIIAVFLYAIYIPLAILFVKWLSVDIYGFFYGIIGDIFMFLIPYVLCTNLFDIRIKTTKNNTASITVGIIFSLISLIVGIFTISLGMANI